jgi:hypothetical protein
MIIHVLIFSPVTEYRSLEHFDVCLPSEVALHPVLLGMISLQYYKCFLLKTSLGTASNLIVLHFCIIIIYQYDN